jgi:NAD(P)-dependent dehydrogenase (short-subunit alcohol dehydrogenase family)
VNYIADLFSLKGQLALVTGASSGIGLHAAHLFSMAGATVALAARRTDWLQNAVDAIQGRGGRAAGFEVDVTRSDTIPQLFDAIEDKLGAAPDILLNNAGVIVAERFLQMTENQFDHVLDTNLKGSFLVAQESARRMVLNKRGSIINVTSTSALRAAGLMVSYGASNAGLIHATKIMALELAGKGIRVNAICPGNIETDMQSALAEFKEPMIRRTPMRRFGKPEDLDGVLLLLASEAGRYMTGSVIVVDGGVTLSWM